MRYAAITFLLLALVTCGAKRAHAKRSNSPAIELNQKLTSDYMDRETRRLEAILALAPTKAQASANVNNPQPFAISSSNGLMMQTVLIRGPRDLLLPIVRRRRGVYVRGPGLMRRVIFSELRTTHRS